jgi:RNA polymerase sigma-70 factor, ECF subfamily
MDPAPSDSELVRACARGDSAAFEALYRRYQAWITGLARRFTGDDAAALDVLQETFAYLLRKGPSLRLDGRLTTFLYPVVRNLSLAMRPKRPPAAHADEQGREAANRGPELQHLASAVDSLPDGQREVLLMRFAHDMLLDEIAAALGLPLGTVKSRLHLALKALREDPRAIRHFE